MIIFLYGEDEFRSLEKLTEIKIKFLEKNKEGGTLFVFDFTEKEVRAENLLMDLSSGGLFSNKKLAIIKNALQNKKFTEDADILNFLKKSAGEESRDITVIFWESVKFEKKAKLTKHLLASSKCEEFQFLEGAKFTSWIKDKVNEKSRRDVSISFEATQKLATFVGSDNLYLLANEIEKVVNFKSKGEISGDDIDLMVKSKIDTDVFKTIDALSGNDKRSALELLHNHLSSGDDPFYLLSMYFYQFRNLLKIKPFLDKQMPEREIAQKLKLHPFVVRKSAAQSRGLSLMRLKEIYKNLCNLDYKAKTGKVAVELALDRFVASV